MAKEPWRARSLVLEVTARTVIFEGQRTELPIKEFELLAALAAQPGEAVSARDLIDKVWPESSVMTPHDLYWYVWSLRKLIGDSTREAKLISNRRGFGYFLDLGPEAVEILKSHSTTPTVDIDVERDESKPAGDDQPIPLVAVERPAAVNATLVAGPPHQLRVVAGIFAGVATLLLLSWFAGYWLSQRGSPELSEAPETNVTPSSASPNQKHPKADASRKPGNEKRPRDRKSSRGGGDGSGGGVLVAGGGTPITDSGSDLTANPGAPSGDRPGNPRPGSPHKPSPGDKPEPRDDEPNDAPPQPNAVLYHLFNPDSDDHYATTSSSVANQKQASGYRVSNEGRVFTTQVPGTVAIGLSDGTTYIYRDSSAAPAGASVAELYRLSGDGDSFYTTSSSEVNQAQARGWSQSIVGYVGT